MSSETTNGLMLAAVGLGFGLIRQRSNGKPTREQQPGEPDPPREPMDAPTTGGLDGQPTQGGGESGSPFTIADPLDPMMPNQTIPQALAGMRAIGLEPPNAQALARKCCGPETDTKPAGPVGKPIRFPATKFSPFTGARLRATERLE